MRALRHRTCWVAFLLAACATGQDGMDSLIQALDGQVGEERIRTLGEINWRMGYADPERALGFALEENKVAASSEDPALQALAANDLGIAYQRLGRISDAIAANRKALRLRRSIGDSAGIGSSASKLGVAYLETADLDSALFFQLMALEIFERRGDSLPAGQALGNLSAIHERLKQWDKALEYAERSVERARNASPYLEGVALAQLSNVRLKRKEPELGIAPGERAFALLAQVNARSELAGLANNLGVMYRDRGDDERGAYYYERALEMAMAIGDLNSVAHYRINLANVRTDQGAYREARELYAQALSVSRAEGYARLTELALEGAATVAERSGDLQQALEHRKELAHLRDSLRTSERMQQIADMHVKYETERTQRELAEERERSAVQQADLRTQRAMIGLLIAAVIAVLATAGVLVLRQRHKAREQLQERIIAERERGLKAAFQSAETERRRLARELHDGVGQQLGALRLRLDGLRDRAAGEDREMLDMVLNGMKETGQDVRDMAHRMLPKALEDLGLAPAIGDMLKRSFERSGIHCDYDHHGMNGGLPPDLEVAVYRIAQELVGNIIKHARAQQVQVQLFKNKEHLVLLVEDDGRGFRIEDPSNGLGMQNIRDRARMLHGTFEIGPGAERGTLARIRIPLAPLPA